MTAARRRIRHRGGYSNIRFGRALTPRDVDKVLLAVASSS